MKQYLDALKLILEEGIDKPSNSTAGGESVTRRSYFTIPFRHDMKDGFPLLTTKKVFWNGIVAEAIWFLEGQYNIKDFRYAKYLKFWEPWADENGNVQSPYGYHWRNYPVINEEKPWEKRRWRDGNFAGVHIDQISVALKALKKNPFSNRAGVVIAWHPFNIRTSKQPPCHYTFYLNVGGDGRLNLHWTQRSCDFPVGVPFNIASYALLLSIFATILEREPGILTASFLDAHMYSNQLEGVKEQLLRTPKTLPRLEIKQPIIFEEKSGIIAPLEMRTFELIGYEPYPKIDYGDIAISYSKISNDLK